MKEPRRTVISQHSAKEKETRTLASASCAGVLFRILEQAMRPAATKVDGHRQRCSTIGARLSREGYSRGLPRSEVCTSRLVGSLVCRPPARVSINRRLPPRCRVPEQTSKMHEAIDARASRLSRLIKSEVVESSRSGEQKGEGR